jgi:hypothetical protein
MKGSAMPMSPEDLEELKSLIAVARKRPLNFAICMGKKPEDTVFMMHRMKAPDVLARLAKKEGDTAKVAFGEVNAKGKKIMLTCHDDIPAGIAKRTKLFLRSVDMPMKIVMLDATGAMVEDDGDPDEIEDGLDEVEAVEDQAEEAPTAAPPADTTPSQDPQAAAWAKAASAFQPLVDAFVAAGSDRAAQVDAAWKAAIKAAADGKIADAMAVAAKLKPIITAQAGQGSTPTQDAAAWKTARDGMMGLYERALGFNPTNRTQLEAAWAMAEEKAEADPASALKILDRLRPALEAVVAAGASGSDTQSIPQDVVPFQRARVLWAGTRAKMMDEIRKLEDSIIAFCEADEDLAAVAAEARNLSKRIAIFDASLETTLDEITNSAEGDQRTALKKLAMDKVRAYAAALNDEFFKAVDADNGFTNVAVASTARQSLAAIAKTLA